VEIGFPGWEVVEHDDQILVNTWYKMAEELGHPFAYCTTDEVTAFWATLPDDTILITGCSDGSVRLQAHHPVNEDLPKHVRAGNWQEMAAVRDKYIGVQVGPACRQDRCSPSDCFSIKTERYTWATFSEVPQAVRHWFSTNVDVEHQRIDLLPFGLNNDGPGASLVNQFAGRPKSALLYVNFQVNTLERVRLKDHFSRSTWMTFRHQPDLPVDQYLAEMGEHKFVLCPEGNGLDCYRIWESLYLGCIPILQNSHFAQRLHQLCLPVVILNDLALVSPHLLGREYERISGGDYSPGMDVLRRSTWRRFLSDFAAK
jgi:hypothetical protein